MTNDRHELSNILAEADRRITALGDSDLSGLGPVLHACAALMGTVDAFYVCLYMREAEMLHFVYNFDGRVFDDPVILPMGGGPTSWAVRHKRPFILNEGSEATQSAGVSFGDIKRATLSAVHVPMRVLAAGDSAGDGGARASPVRVVGVFSAQSYKAGAYGAEVIGALQWLADRAGLALSRLNFEPVSSSPVQRTDGPPDAEGITAAVLAENFAKMMKRIGQRTEAVQRMIPPENTGLRSAADLLRHECRLVQDAAARLYPPPEASRTPDTGQEEASPSDPLATLSQREREILEHLVAGRSNAAVSRLLHISGDTVKFHCHNVYQKLRVDNRTQAVQVFMAYALSPTSEP